MIFNLEYLCAMSNFIISEGIAQRISIEKRKRDSLQLFEIWINGFHYQINYKNEERKLFNAEPCFNSKLVISKYEEINALLNKISNAYSNQDIRDREINQKMLHKIFDLFSNKETYMIRIDFYKDKTIAHQKKMIIKDKMSDYSIETKSFNFKEDV